MCTLSSHLNTSSAITHLLLLLQMLEQLKKKADSNIFIYCLFVIVQYILLLVELVTKFATVSRTPMRRLLKRWV